jgi:hypothetical protein
VDWFKVEARISTNEKIDGLSDRAFRGLINLWGYATLHETGGCVPAGAARLVPRVTPRVLAELEGADFIHRNGAGWVVHDWDEYQEGVEELAERRRKAKERQAKHRRLARQRNA